MTLSLPSLLSQIELAYTAKALMPSTYENLLLWLKEPSLPEWAVASISFLVERQAWDEINDRFYKTLAFGTGGMRGRTLGKLISPAEQGSAVAGAVPDHAAVGTNCMNDFNVIRASLGLFRYTKAYCKLENPVLVVSHDVRHFSRHFAELTASVWEKAGGKAFVFDGPRSTPQLSFSVRYLKAQAGVMITASHNPFHDNGYKVYFSDGAQVVFPHAEGIIEAVQAVQLSEISALLDIQPSFKLLSKDLDSAYLKCVLESVIDSSVFEKSDLKVVFSPLHGTGGVISVAALDALGINRIAVPDQDIMDGRFPTVASPNPEMPEALAMAIQQAERTQAHLVLATDPDADRMGAAVADENGKMVLLSGNSIGSLLAAYRIGAYKEKGWLNKDNVSKAALIKTFVTSPLQEAIAKAEGLKLVQTLTGFKWIGAKLRAYEEALKASLHQEGKAAIDYDSLPLKDRAELLLGHSTWFVFGGEESYGYLGNDAVRDKDANAATLMLCELAAALRKQGKTLLQYLDELYLKYGYYTEGLINIYYEGANGALKIKKILDSYASSPPKAIGGIGVKRCLNFRVDSLTDADGDAIPKELFYFVDLENGSRYALRGSGTEPKIKFYLFAHQAVSGSEALSDIQQSTQAQLQALKQALEDDAKHRADL